MLNTNLKLPWTLDRQPTFTGILHVGEEVPIIRTAATINNKYSPNVIVNGKEVTFTPDYDLDYGFNRVYVSVAFENGHIACAYWNFEVKKNPPQISGFLGDAKGRRYFICFDGEIDSKKIEDKSNWKLNGSSDLIEKVNYMNFGDWAIVYLVDESKHQDFRDQDYHLSYDAGRGSTECLLIPEEKQPRDGGCGSVSHDEINDVHFSVESESHALTYHVTRPPDCELRVEWQLDTKSVVNHSNPADTPLIFDRDSQDIIPQQMTHIFPVGEGHHTLFFPWDCHSRLKVIVYEPGNPPITVWESPEWNFPADTSTPEYTLPPVMMNGEDAAVFVEEHYWEKTQLPQGELPLQIQNMIDSLNSPLTRCRKLVLWGAEDRFPPGQPHIGCLNCYNYLDWGWNPEEPPEGIWCPEPMSEWDAFVVDLPPYHNSEYRMGWSDPEHCPLPKDALSSREYKLWVFDYDLFVSVYKDEIAEHVDTFIMRPRVHDTAQTRGNWLRANNIYLMNQDFTGSVVRGYFIADNPYDNDNNVWKIVKFDAADIDPDKETTFIYNRAIDGSNDGDVKLDYFILLEENENVVNPSAPLDVKFTSTETTFPSECDHDVTLKAYMTYGSEIPGGIERLNELFEPTSECPKYYHTYVTISDNKFTSSEDHILFVSHSDGELVGDDEMDYATSISNEFILNKTITSFNFGTSRGSGRDKPIKYPKNNHWYSYDEFITNGGFEIVEAEIVTEGVDPPTQNEYVPVQSEADVMLIESHGEYSGYPDKTTDKDYITTLSFSYPQAIYTDKSNKWRDNADEFNANNIEAPLCVGNQFCSDFSSEPNAGWGNFWLKEGGELRWLAFCSCYTMTHTEGKDIRLNWKNIINDNYISSVCGFTDEVYGHFEFFTYYGQNLQALYNQVGGYESLTEVCLPGHEDYYSGYDPNVPDSWKANASKDLSVAAWMEAAVKGFENVQYRSRWADLAIWSASAINDEVFHTTHYYFFLEPIDEEGVSADDKEMHRCLHRIKKELLVKP